MNHFFSLPVLQLVIISRFTKKVPLSISLIGLSTLKGLMPPRRRSTEKPSRARRRAPSSDRRYILTTFFLIFFRLLRIVSESGNTRAKALRELRNV